MRQALSPDPVVFNDCHHTWANSEGTTLLETLKTLSQAVQDLQKRADDTNKCLNDTNKSLNNSRLEETQNKVEAKSKDLEKAQKAIMKYEKTFDALTIEVRPIVLEKWAGKPISNNRRSQRNAAAHGGSILADYDAILRGVDQPAPRVDRWKPVFGSHYNASWEFLYAQGSLDAASKELVRMFDYLANTRSLERWENWKTQSNHNTSSKKFQDRAEIVETCTS